jgi:hypothetical protein
MFSLSWENFIVEFEEIQLIDWWMGLNYEYKWIEFKPGLK